MTQPQENNRENNSIFTWIENLLNPILSHLGNAIGKIAGILLILFVTLYVIRHQGGLLSFADFSFTDPQVLLPLGASTALVFFMTTMLSTPVSVAVGIAMIIYFIINGII